jgi:hypothetical protein
MCASCGNVGLGFCETTRPLWDPLCARLKATFDLEPYMIFLITDRNDALIGY